MSKIKYTEQTLSKKSDEQLKEILQIDFGHTLSSEDKSSSELIALILSLQKGLEEREENKFDFLNHLSEHLPMTEEMITDAFYTSSPSFRNKYLKDADITEERKKDIFYEVRDIVVSNNFKVIRPNADSKLNVKEKAPVEKKVKEKKVEAPVVEKENPIAVDVETKEDQAPQSPATDIDPTTLTKKGDKVNYVIDVLINEGNDLLSGGIKAKQVMDKYSTIFDDSVSDGYAYDKIVERKKRGQ
jgi:hypothetical protein